MPNPKMRLSSKSAVLSGAYLEKDSGDETDSDIDSSDSGKTVANSDWTPEDHIRLLCQVKNLIPEHDRIPFVERTKKINWHQVRIKSRSFADIKAEFHNIIKSMRTFRLLEEMIKEKHSELIPKLGLKKPKSAFVLFLQDNKDEVNKILKRNPKKGSFTQCGSIMFKECSNELRESYRTKAARERERYEKLITEYKIPKSTRKVNEKVVKYTPMQLFLQEQLLKNPKCSKKEVRKQYTNLPKEQKLNWILRWLGLKPGEKVNEEKYLNCKECLTKTEMKIFEDTNNMFIRDNLTNKSFNPNSNASPRANYKSSILEWKHLKERQKTEYVLKSKTLREHFIEDFNRFVTSLPLDRQKCGINLSEKETTLGEQYEETAESDELHGEENAKVSKCSLSLDENEPDEGELDFEHNVNSNADNISDGRFDIKAVLKKSLACKTNNSEDGDRDSSYSYYEDVNDENCVCDASSFDCNVELEWVDESNESKHITQESPKQTEMTRITINPQSSKQKLSTIDTDDEKIPPLYKAGSRKEGKNHSKDLIESPKMINESFSDSEDESPTISKKRKTTPDQSKTTDTKKFKTATSSNLEFTENQGKACEEKAAQLENNMQKIFRSKPLEAVECYAHLKFEFDEEDAKINKCSLKSEENDSDQDELDCDNRINAVYSIRDDSGTVITKSYACKSNETKDGYSYSYHDDDYGENFSQCDITSFDCNLKQEWVDESKHVTHETPKQTKMTRIMILHSTPNENDKYLKFAKIKPESSKQEPLTTDTDEEEIPPSYKAGIRREGKNESKGLTESLKMINESFPDSEDESPTKSKKRKTIADQINVTDSKKFNKAATSLNLEFAQNQGKAFEEKTRSLEKNCQKVLRRRPLESVDCSGQLNFDEPLKKRNKSLSTVTKKGKEKLEVGFHMAQSTRTSLKHLL